VFFPNAARQAPSNGPAARAVSPSSWTSLPASSGAARFDRGIDYGPTHKIGLRKSHDIDVPGMSSMRAYDFSPVTSVLIGLPDDAG